MKKGISSLRILAALAALAAVPGAYAAHPYVTDDTGTQGQGNWQLEVLAERARTSASADLGAGPVRQGSRALVVTPVLTFGLLDDLDIALGGAYQRQRTSEDGVLLDEASGRGDSTLELKWRFYEEDGLSLAFKPGLTLSTGDENRGLGSGKVSWAANLILTRDAKPWTWLANLAYQHSRYALEADNEGNHADLWRLSAGFAYGFAEKLRLVGEAGVRTNPARGDPFAPLASGRFAMLGIIYSPSEKMDLDLGLRHKLNSAEPDSVILAGATFRW
jgi:hypothetical protein